MNTNDTAFIFLPGSRWRRKSPAACGLSGALPRTYSESCKESRPGLPTLLHFRIRQSSQYVHSERYPLARKPRLAVVNIHSTVRRTVSGSTLYFTVLYVHLSIRACFRWSPRAAYWHQFTVTTGWSSGAKRCPKFVWLYYCRFFV